jgi:hypothetical protein
MKRLTTVANDHMPEAICGGSAVKFPRCPGAALLVLRRSRREWEGLRA